MNFFTALRFTWQVRRTLRRVGKVIAEYEKTRDPRLLDTMRRLKPAALTTAMLLEAPHPRGGTLGGSTTASAYKLLGGLSLYLAEFGEAWDRYDKARQIAEAEGNTEEVVVALNNLGTVAYEQKDYGVAIELYRDAESRARGLPRTVGILPYVRNNIARAERALSR